MSESYFEYLEHQFAADDPWVDESVPGVIKLQTGALVSISDDRPITIAADRLPRVGVGEDPVTPSRAELLTARMGLRPRTKLGPLFGLTARDLDRAVESLTNPRTALSPTASFWKRAIDIVISASAVLISAPVILFLGLLITLESRGAVFYFQNRVGRNGKQFRMLKLRTMYIDAELKLGNHLAALADGEGTEHVLFKMKSDPRVTRIGRFLRRYSLDELPQFWNVIKGDMSIVGPRPPLVREYRDPNRPLDNIRPGITGLWVLYSGLSNPSWEAVQQIDREYVKNWSVGLDLSIMFRTARYAG